MRAVDPEARLDEPVRRLVAGHPDRPELLPDRRRGSRARGTRRSSRELGVNIYVGNNARHRPAQAASDLATLKGLGMYAIIGQDSVGLANVDDPTIVGWWMTPDEPDNAQPDGQRRLRPAGRSVRRSSTQYDAVQGGGPDAARSGSVSVRASRTTAGRVAAATRRPSRGYVPASDIVALRHLPVQQLRRRHERAGHVRPVLAERVRRRPTPPVVEPQPGGVDRLRDDGHRRRHDRPARRPRRRRRRCGSRSSTAPTASATSSTRGTRRSARTRIFEDPAMVTAVTALEQADHSRSRPSSTARRSRTSSPSRAATRPPDRHSW